MCAKASAQLLVLAGTLLVVAGTADASHRGQGRYQSARYISGSTIVYAEVSSVQPLIEQIHTQVPVRECQESTAYAPPAYGSPRPRSAVGGTIVGGVIGGVIGDQFGGGEGRDAMRLFGALVGAAMGHEAASRRQAAYYPQPAAEPYPVTNCTTHYETRVEERTRGYRVAYVYDGREYYTEMANHPGDRIPIEVSVRPAY
ncbi:MAG: glycine zipper 2TM domain-containing protein [Gammaproteobacteria bacterium]|nr:glycine zipper 2TM domain-containing protein [Gammaproteobacteria bacterium]MDH5275255.1 glycine zipper 2TM domain-containing protein [Gammaproteobacteria bacterium]